MNRLDKGDPRYWRIPQADERHGVDDGLKQAILFGLSFKKGTSLEDLQVRLQSRGKVTSAFKLEEALTMMARSHRLTQDNQGLWQRK